MVSFCKKIIQQPETIEAMQFIQWTLLYAEKSNFLTKPAKMINKKSLAPSFGTQA